MLNRGLSEALKKVKIAESGRCGAGFLGFMVGFGCGFVVGVWV